LPQGSASLHDSAPLVPPPRYTGFSSSLSSPRSKIPGDVRASLESQLSDSHQDRVHQLAERLRTNIDLESDEILAALKHSPLTATHAQARTTELLSDVIAADQQVSARRHADQLAQKDSELHALQHQLDSLKQQLYKAQTVQHTTKDKAGHVAAERAHLQIQVGNFNAFINSMDLVSSALLSHI